MAINDRNKPKNRDKLTFNERYKMGKKWYKEVYQVSFKRYEDINSFIKKLNNEERRVIGYQVTFGSLFDEVTVTFADLK